MFAVGRRAVFTVTALIAGALVIAPAATASAGKSVGSGIPANPGQPVASADDTTLATYAADLWASLDAMTDPDPRLPADNIEGDLTAPSGFTSPPNIRKTSSAQAGGR